MKKIMLLIVVLFVATQLFAQYFEEHTLQGVYYVFADNLSTLQYLIRTDSGLTTFETVDLSKADWANQPIDSNPLAEVMLDMGLLYAFTMQFQGSYLYLTAYKIQNNRLYYTIFYVHKTTAEDLAKSRINRR